MDGEITVTELDAFLGDEGEDGNENENQNEDLRIVDIRNQDAFERGHIPGSENIPAPELTDRVTELDGAGRVVTVCPHGKASVQAARLIGSYEGVNGPVQSLHGGLEAWGGPFDTAESHSTATDGRRDDEPAAPF